MQSVVPACSATGAMGRISFYHVFDIFQQLGIRDRRFDTLVLHFTGSGSGLDHSGNGIIQIEKYVVFNKQDQHQRPQDQETRRRNVMATFIYYDGKEGIFRSDGVYREYLFDPESAISAENAHIANERFAFYKMSGNDQKEDSQTSCSTD